MKENQGNDPDSPAPSVRRHHSSSNRLLANDPLNYEIDDLLLLNLRQLRPLRDLPPFLQAPPTASCRRMLRLEDRMPPHRGLPSVVQRLGGSEPATDEILRVSANRIHPLLRNVPAVFIRQPEPATELRPRQSLERHIKRHFPSLTSAP